MYRQWRNKYSRVLAKFALLSISAISVMGSSPNNVRAASPINTKDTLTTVNTSATADHVIQFTLDAASSFAAGDQIQVDFPATFVANAAGSWQTTDFTFNDGTARTITAVGATPTCTAGANNVTVAIDTNAVTFTVKACTSYSASASAASVTFTIFGTATTGTGTLTNPASAATATVLIVSDDKGNGIGSDDDTTQIAIPIIADDSVNITAKVDPAISFSISDTTVGFGTLTSANAKYATGDTTGSTSSSTVAHQMTISTNATTGYVITYRGAAFTSMADSNDTITAASITGNVNGTAGTEQFGLAVSGTGPTYVFAYQNAQGNWAYVANTTTQIASETGPAPTRTIDVKYIANISTATEAGVYATDIFYIATATF